MMVADGTMTAPMVIAATTYCLNCMRDAAQVHSFPQIKHHDSENELC